MPEICSSADNNNLGNGSILIIIKLAIGKVVGGQVVHDGASFDEGASATVLAKDDFERFDLTPEQEAELLASIDEAGRDDSFSAGEVLAGLTSSRD